MVALFISFFLFALSQQELLIDSPPTRVGATVSVSPSQVADGDSLTIIVSLLNESHTPLLFYPDCPAAFSIIAPDGKPVYVQAPCHLASRAILKPGEAVADTFVLAVTHRAQIRGDDVAKSVRLKAGTLAPEPEPPAVFWPHSLGNIIKGKYTVLGGRRGDLDRSAWPGATFELVGGGDAR